MRIGSAMRSGSSRGRVQPVEYANGGPPAAGKPRAQSAGRQRPRSAGATRRVSGSDGKSSWPRTFAQFASGGGGTSSSSRDIGSGGRSGGSGGQSGKGSSSRDPLRPSGQHQQRPASAAALRQHQQQIQRPTSAKAAPMPVSAWLNGRNPPPDVPTARPRSAFGRPGSTSGSGSGHQAAAKSVERKEYERREYRPPGGGGGRPGHGASSGRPGSSGGSSGYGQQHRSHSTSRDGDRGDAAADARQIGGDWVARRDGSKEVDATATETSHALLQQQQQQRMLAQQKAVEQQQRDRSGGYGGAGGQQQQRPTSASNGDRHRVAYGGSNTADKQRHPYGGSSGVPPRPYSAHSGRDAAAAKAAAYQQQQLQQQQRPQSASAARPSHHSSGQRLLVNSSSNSRGYGDSAQYPSYGNSSSGYATRPQSAQPSSATGPSPAGGGNVAGGGSSQWPSQRQTSSAILDGDGAKHALQPQGGTNRPQSAGGAVRHGSNGAPQYHCAPEQREYLTRLLVGSVQNRRGLPDFYSFGKVIGVGSFGTVRIAWHKLTGQKVAIKTYERSKMKDPQQWKRVQQEARVMEKLSDSPLVCRFLEAFETMAPRRAHLIMEFLPGGNLCSYVKAKRKIAEPELQPLLLQLATALDHMHSLNIVHRDIKLENILFLDERRTIVRVIDFGFSTRCAPDRRLRLFCGTPSYMAPEIVRRTEYRGKPIDLWSIGVVAYACLGGHFPFAARSQPELYRKILRGTYRLPENLSQGAVSLLQSCLVVDVMRRINAPDLKRHPFVQGGHVNGAMPGANLGALTRSQNPQDDVRREAISRMETLGVPRDALIQGITRGEHTPITSCYYLLMDSMGLRTGPGAAGSSSTKHNNENEMPEKAKA